MTINAGGVLDITRGSVTANATNTTASTTALANNFSGVGNINLSAVVEATPPGTAIASGWGVYSLNGNSAGFSGNFNLGSGVRLNPDNSGGDELGTATVNVVPGSSILLSGGTADFDNNIFNIAGTGWSNAVAASVANGAIRFDTNGTMVTSNEFGCYDR